MGREGRGPGASVSEGFSSLLVTEVGVIVRDKVLTQEGVVWVLMAFLAFVWKGMMYREDMSVRTFTSFPSHLTE